MLRGDIAEDERRPDERATGKPQLATGPNLRGIAHEAAVVTTNRAGGSRDQTQVFSGPAVNSKS